MGRCTIPPTDSTFFYPKIKQNRRENVTYLKITAFQGLFGSEIGAGFIIHPLFYGFSGGIELELMGFPARFYRNLEKFRVLLLHFLDVRNPAIRE